MSELPRYDLDLLYLYKKPEDIHDFLKENKHLKKYTPDKTNDVLVWALDHLFRARHDPAGKARALTFFKALAREKWPAMSLKRLLVESFELGEFDHLAGFSVKNMNLNFRKKLLEQMAKNQNMESLNRLMLHLPASQQNSLLPPPSGSLMDLQHIINLYKTPASHFHEAFKALTLKRWKGMTMLLCDLPEDSLENLVKFCIQENRYDFLDSVFAEFSEDVQKRYIVDMAPKTHHKNLLTQKSRFVILEGINQAAPPSKPKTKL